jgi:hypothetical protein
MYQASTRRLGVLADAHSPMPSTMRQIARATWDFQAATFDLLRQPTDFRRPENRLVFLAGASSPREA